MSNLEARPAETVCGSPAAAATAPAYERLSGREVVLGGIRGLPVVRTLPNRDRRMVGAWCFLDQFGPHSIDGGPGMRVPPHPHTGLQTVTWLVDGEVHHRDSLGSDQLIRPGQLNLMTAGRGIAHSEESPPGHGPRLHGVQLWVALPARHRDVAPAFDHHAHLPVLTGDGVTLRLLMGEIDGELGPATSPARTFSPLVAAEVTLAASASLPLTLEPDFEYAVLTLAGVATVDGEALTGGPLLYLGAGRSNLTIDAGPSSTTQPTRVLILGGEPFDEKIVMWWNFIARSHDEIVQARQEWMSGATFGEVRGFDGPALAAPDLPTTPLRPRGRQR